MTAPNQQAWMMFGGENSPLYQHHLVQRSPLELRWLCEAENGSAEGLHEHILFATRKAALRWHVRGSSLPHAPPATSSVQSLLVPGLHSSSDGWREAEHSAPGTARSHVYPLCAPINSQEAKSTSPKGSLHPAPNGMPGRPFLLASHPSNSKINYCLKSWRELRSTLLRLLEQDQLTPKLRLFLRGKGCTNLSRNHKDPACKDRTMLLIVLLLLNFL